MRTAESIRAAALRRQSRHLMRRARGEADLMLMLPPELEQGVTYHVISQGDVDSLSYLAHIVKAQPLDYLLISTWVMAMSDVKLLGRWLDEGRLGVIEFAFGEHMPGQYGDVYQAARTLAEFTGGRANVARNHAKVILAGAKANEFWAVVES